MTTTIETIGLTDTIQQAFENHLAKMPANSVIREKRVMAMEHFLRMGIPDKHHEEYKYSNPRTYLKDNLKMEAAGELNVPAKRFKKLLPLKNAHVIVMVNGIFSSELSQLIPTDSSLLISNLSSIYSSQRDVIETHYGLYADVASDAFIALNTALAKDGAYIRVAANTVVNEPVHIINLISSSESFFANTRNLIIAEAGSKIDILETFVSMDSANNEKLFTNHVSEIVVQENAQVSYCKIQAEEGNTAQINTCQVHQKKGSLFNNYTFSLSGEFVRNNLNIVLDDQNCEAHLFGLYLPRKGEHIDNHTLVDHRKPNCFSNELYKGIMSDASTGVFNGKIFVRQDAQKTNAFQSNRNMLLGDEASVNTKPQLEIYADDVKCSHGTSTGRMDEEAMFYLRSRGLSEQSAKNLLMQAFAEEVVNAIRFEPLKAYIVSLIDNRFA